MKALAPALLLLAACAPPQGAGAPGDAPAPDPFEGQRLFLTEDGVRVEDDPYARRTVRQAEHDVHATLLAKDVALVVEPAEGAPIRVSNLLGAALVRRFAGELDEREALSAAKVFLIRPLVALDGARYDGVLLVDWRLRAETARDVGAVYATRRLSGVIRRDPWDAFTPEDAEFIALQTAAQILETEAVRNSLIAARDVAVFDRAPTPTLRPRAVEPIDINPDAETLTGE